MSQKKRAVSPVQLHVNELHQNRRDGEHNKCISHQAQPPPKQRSGDAEQAGREEQGEDDHENAHDSFLLSHNCYQSKSRKRVEKGYIYILS